MRRISLKKRKANIAEELEGHTELLIEILVLLPPKSILKCRCVSKRWNGIIVDPLFRKTYSSSRCGRLLAFVQKRSKLTGPRAKILSIAQQDELNTNLLPHSFGTVIYSLDGLFLCNYFLKTGDNDYECRYHVVNPLTRTWVQLPMHHRRLHGAGLACKENMKELVPSFKVIGIVERVDFVEGRDTLAIETYSHDTGRWATLRLANESVPLHPLPILLMLVCNGVFHWRMHNNMAIYNSNREDNFIHLIKLPEHNDLYATATRSSADDLLWISTGKEIDGILKFWKLRIDDYYSYKSTTTIPEDQWILMHSIHITSLYNDMTLVLKSKNMMFKETTGGSNRPSVKMEALIPSNPVAAVLNLQQKMFLYNLESHSLELVQYHGRPYSERRIDGWLPFTEPCSLSSYGPLGSTY